MKNAKRILALLLVACSVVCLFGCGPKLPAATTTAGNGTTTGGNGTSAGGNVPAGDQLQFAEGTVLRMATGYNSKITGLFFDASQFGEKYPNGITLADGKTYNAGDLKPTWVEVQNRLGMVFENKYQGNNATKEWGYWEARLNEVDVVSGTAELLTQAGNAGQVINLAEYLDKMPNFKAYLEANPIVRLSVTGNVNNGAIYFSPYFDGVNDIERMPLMRTDWVEKLLNGEGEFTAEKSANLAASVYTPYMPTTGKVEVEVVKADGSAVEKISKDYAAAGNIVKIMNDALAAGTVTGVQAVNMLRKYIDEAYNGYYGNNRADLFIGQNAAWDADELVALLRCVVANAQTLNGTDTVYGLFAREDNTQRRVDVFRFAGTLFGVRGLESRQQYLYVGADGKLHDARQEADTFEALERMNAMAAEGLIAPTVTDGVDDDSAKTENILKNDLGFMHYDYNQTQTIYNETALQDGEKYMAVMVPVARWYDGSNEDGVYMRFTESWRSVKTDGWAISKAGVGNNQDKLYAALKLIDYAYSKEGQILMSYGPDAFIATNADGSYKTFNFNGEQMPVIADATYNELWDKAKGNYTNYARQFLGSTLSFVKSQAFEYQCTHIVGKEGAGHISTAIGLGVIKHPELALAENPWYTSVPTVLPLSTGDNTVLSTLKESLTAKFGSAKTDVNLFINQIADGYSAYGEGVTDAASAVATISKDWKGSVYLTIVQEAYERLVAYYGRISN